jgi:hypothetical protein
VFKVLNIQKVVESIGKNWHDKKKDQLAGYEGEVTEIRHHQKGHEFAQASRNGCYLCSLLMGTLMEEHGEDGKEFHGLSYNERVKHSLAEEI